MMINDNKSLGAALREAHSHWVRGQRGDQRRIRLPADNHIRFHKSGIDAYIEMDTAAVTSNMQDSISAFEGWAICLWHWLSFRHVTLRWCAPDNAASSRHYARFLYRVQRFADLFPDRFRIGTPDLLDACLVRSGTPLFLNVAGSKWNEGAERKGESKIECDLVGRHSALLFHETGADRVARQFPVGLYRAADLKGPVFTGGTSAIDIVAYDGLRFDVIELKAGSNISVGAVSELLFYAFVMRDAAGEQPRFLFGHGSAGRSDIRPQDVRDAKAVRAILLAEQFHPLLESSALLDMLNSAAVAQSHRIPLTFDFWRLTNFETEPVISRISEVA